MASARSITVLGAGPVGATLARSLAGAGYRVVIATCDPRSTSMADLVHELGGGAFAALAPADE